MYIFYLCTVIYLLHKFRFPVVSCQHVLIADFVFGWIVVIILSLVFA